jgi:hypothetical protein
MWLGAGSWCGPGSDPEKVPTGDTTKAIPAMVEERDTESLTAEDEAAVNACRLVRRC